LALIDEDEYGMGNKAMELMKEELEAGEAMASEVEKVVEDTLIPKLRGIVIQPKHKTLL